MAAKRFSCILEAPDSLSWNLLGGGHGPVALPLKSAYGLGCATPHVPPPQLMTLETLYYSHLLIVIARRSIYVRNKHIFYSPLTYDLDF